MENVSVTSHQHTDSATQILKLKLSCKIGGHNAVSNIPVICHQQQISLTKIASEGENTKFLY